MALSIHTYPGCARIPTLTHQKAQYTNKCCSVSYGHTMYLAMFFGQCLFVPKFPVKEELQQTNAKKEPSFKTGVRVHKYVQYLR